MHIKIKHQCKICSKFFRNARRLNKHLRQKHDSNSLYKCEFCDKTYADRTQVKIHMKSKHLAELKNECQLSKTNQTKNTTDNDRTIVVIPILKRWMNGNSKLSILRKKEEVCFCKLHISFIVWQSKNFPIKNCVIWQSILQQKKIPTIARTTNIANLELHFEAKIGQFLSNNEKIIIFVVSKPF